MRTYRPPLRARERAAPPVPTAAPGLCAQGYPAGVRATSIPRTSRNGKLRSDRWVRQFQARAVNAASGSRVWRQVPHARRNVTGRRVRLAMSQRVPSCSWTAVIPAGLNETFSWL